MALRLKACGKLAPTLTCQGTLDHIMPVETLTRRVQAIGDRAQLVGELPFLAVSHAAVPPIKGFS